MIDISREIAAPSSQELDINDTTKNSLAASKLYQHNGACRVVTSNLKPLENRGPGTMANDPIMSL